MEELQVYIRTSYYNGNLPKFYREQDFPELKVLTDNWQVIRDEIMAYERKFGLSGINTLLPPALSGANNWSNIYFENFLWRYHRNRKHFPQTCALYEQVSGYTYAAFSILSPGGEIQPHYGDTNGIIRCHLGISIPAAYPDCGIRVGDEESDWQNGKFTMFTEAHLHNTWNHSNNKRYIFVLDIVHPNWKTRRMEICARVLGAQTYNFLEKKWKVFKRIPATWLRPIHTVLTLCWRIYLPIQRRMSFS